MVHAGLSFCFHFIGLQAALSSLFLYSFALSRYSIPSGTILAETMPLLCEANRNMSLAHPYTVISLAVTECSTFLLRNNV